MSGFWPTFSRRLRRRLRRRHPLRFVSIELANVCNLRCAYCIRDEDMLYGRPDFPSPDRIFSIVDQARTAWKNVAVTFTGGEPLLHPQFGAVLRGLAVRDVPFRFVTNGWHWDRALPVVLETRDQLQAAVFSIDGATMETHDAHRGSGSFNRLMRAMASAREHALPFQMNVVLRFDTFKAMREISEVSVRLGAVAVNFGSMLPTSRAQFEQHVLGRGAELAARSEAASLSRELGARIRVTLGLHDPAPGAHCSALQGGSLNLDYRGRLSLCGVLSSFRGGRDAADLLGTADGDFTSAAARAQVVRIETLKDRDGQLMSCESAGLKPSQVLGSPCLSCLARFDKIDPVLAGKLGAASGL